VVLKLVTVLEMGIGTVQKLEWSDAYRSPDNDRTIHRGRDDSMLSKYSEHAAVFAGSNRVMAGQVLWSHPEYPNRTGQAAGKGKEPRWRLCFAPPI